MTEADVHVHYHVEKRDKKLKKLLKLILIKMEELKTMNQELTDAVAALKAATTVEDTHIQDLALAVSNGTAANQAKIDGLVGRSRT